ncbi:MAG: EAL domain-containing protein, partial [Lachnospiraceae bacterium]|nr:EAL domain-containing protein [Lachnospiraceae bacterium]
MNRLKMGAGAAVKEQTAPKEHYKALELLLEKNLFQYHFQPIVNAKNGEIYAYEALMRTDASIGMNPLEVLEAAKEYNCLYEIEHATMFNVMERFAKEREKFGERKVFINTIPGYFLKDEDINKLTDKYGKYMDNVVFELTEQNTVSDSELNSIRRMSGENETSRIAIDDYGTGHSNIVNLMRYAPHIIKIDRFLISDIHKDQNKQMFVRSTIEFARMNNIMVLAEGVETSNELLMVIDLGVDLIQGYYTGRPVAEPVTDIALDIKKEILDANPLFGKNM